MLGGALDEGEQAAVVGAVSKFLLMLRKYSFIFLFSSPASLTQVTSFQKCKARYVFAMSDCIAEWLLYKLCMRL